MSPPVSKHPAWIIISYLEALLISKHGKLWMQQTLTHQKEFPQNHFSGEGFSSEFSQLRQVPCLPTAVSYFSAQRIMLSFKARLGTWEVVAAAAAEVEFNTGHCHRPPPSHPSPSKRRHQESKVEYAIATRSFSPL